MGKYHTTRARVVKPVPCVWNLYSQSDSRNIEVHGRTMPNQWFTFRNGQYQNFYLTEEWNEAAMHVAQRLLTGEKYLHSLYARQRQQAGRMMDYCARMRSFDLAQKSVPELVALYDKAEELWLEYDLLNVYPWFLGGDPFQQSVRDQIERVAPALSDDEFMVLVTLPNVSFSGREELELSRIAQEIQERGMNLHELPDDLLAKIDTLVEHYYWIPFGYDGPDTYDRDHYLRLLAEWLADPRRDFEAIVRRYEGYEESLRFKQQEILTKYSLGKDVGKLLGRLHMLAQMTDERKEYQFPVHVAFNSVLAELSARLHTQVTTLKFILHDELQALWENPAELLRRAEERQAGLWIIHCGDDGDRTFLGAEAEDLERELLESEHIQSIIQGSVGCKGQLGSTRGTVRILLSPQDIGRMGEGEILVTSMTSPEFVPAMRRSAAIITDEGGITCHAAIVSRELGLPCIIGTRNATKLLHDGDTVEVDTTNGTVQIIK